MGVEPTTSAMRMPRSSQLSYTPLNEPYYTQIINYKSIITQYLSSSASFGAGNAGLGAKKLVAFFIDIGKKSFVSSKDLMHWFYSIFIPAARPEFVALFEWHFALFQVAEDKGFFGPPSI